MKKIILFVILSVSSISVFGQEQPSFKIICTENLTTKATGNCVQGAAVYGDYLFQFFDANKSIAVYHLPDGELLDEVALNVTKTYHNNNVDFSLFFARKGDEFPVLYASQENIDEHKILAYRLAREGNKFSVELIQTIILPRPVEMGLYYPNVAIDVQDYSLYVTGFSDASWKSNENGNAVVLVKFHLPYIGEGKEVTLGTDKIQARFNFPFRIAAQGASIRNGKLYQLFGVPKYGQCSLCCTDLKNGKMLWSYDIAAAGISKEPEALSFYKNELVVVDVDGNVFGSGLVIPWEIPESIKATAPAFASGKTGKKLICFDLDATLTQHRTNLEQFNRDVLSNLVNKFQCVMVCAGNCPRVRRQMLDFPIDILGNYGMQEAHDVNGNLVIVKQITIPADTASFIRKTNYLREKYGYTEYEGAGVEFHASGMVTFGLLGTEAKSEHKLYFDPDRSKRRAMYPEVLRLFKNYSVYIGGSTSFDFAGKEYNKYDASMRYAREDGFTRDEVIFIGDDFDDGGGDSHVRIKGMDYICIDDYHNFPELVTPLLLH